ncbi:Carbamoyl-phosphate synthase large chain [Enterobacter cancerogenus]|uniref:Carbamoyl-phosphate synthase large chain n=1 Tax=Enterobacter cancerogenus TaxID=69218 RepID=A0A484VUC6_9ENTR|nr:Carbamoyl-phosphate synthase large chain [Enterobacter cancerogenus]
MRNASMAVLREIGVETGGSNVQFSVKPENGPSDCYRNEPARVSFFRAGLQGYRLPDCESGGEAGGGVHPR